MSSTLSERTIALVKATIPALEAHGFDIVQAMYARMFQNPMIRDLFNQSHHGNSTSQPRALTDAILAYARNIDNLSVLVPTVERIAQKHVSLQIQADHYPYVAEALLAAIKDVLGDAATDEIIAAWGEAYWFLADILIARETRIYDELASSDGGWRGWREFVIEDVTPESSVISSFILRPVDGKPVIRHHPGQYLTFWLEIPGHSAIKRNYSISAAANGATYRISVKREPLGLASNWLHDEAGPGTVVKVSPPAGEFFLPEHPERDVVLISGGVGLTPMVSMIETIAQKKLSIGVHYVHGAYSGATHAMGEHILSLASQHSNMSVTTYYQKPRPEDIQGRHYDHVGLLDPQPLIASHGTKADYYLCGPKPFLRTFVSALSLAGIPAYQIHYEFFGPADDLIESARETLHSHDTT